MKGKKKGEPCDFSMAFSSFKIHYCVKKLGHKGSHELDKDFVSDLKQLGRRGF